MKNKILNIIHKGGKRSAKAKKNILQMLFIKGGDILVGLLLVPIALNYVDSETFGIWLALSSMVAWIRFFDIGINNGLKNRLTQALAQKDYVLGRKYVSTTYAILALVFIPAMLLLLCVAQFVNWSNLLNISAVQADGLLTAVCIVIIYFCINFILSTINIVLLADQRPADASLRNFMQNLVSLVIIFAMTLVTKGNLINLCIGLCISPILIVILFNIALFKGRYKQIAPKLSSIDFRVAPDLMKLGMQFFIIQIAGIIQYQMLNFLILRYYGASEVTSYNIAYKYFSVLTMLWGIFTAPLWVATTDAIAKNDYIWIKATQKKYLLLFFGFFVAGALMFVLSQYIYSFWIGDAVQIGNMLSFCILIYCLVTMFGGTYVLILNGVGRLKIQTIASSISPILFLVCCYYFINTGWGIYSVIIAAIISNFNGFLLAPIQYYRMLKEYTRK